jgi:hypothetical protein
MKDGGPAFPLGYQQWQDAHTTGWAAHQPGMSLRDYFAAAALKAWRTTLVAELPESVARWAYADADAMLAEREKTTLG